MRQIVESNNIKLRGITKSEKFERHLGSQLSGFCTYADNSAVNLCELQGNDCE